MEAGINLFDTANLYSLGSSEANTTRQIDEAVASLSIDLTDADVRALEAHYTPR